MVDIVINCICSICEHAGLIIATDADLNAWLAVAPNITGVTCSVCGCVQDLGNGGSNISQTDKSPPRIDGLSPIEGHVSDIVTITGHRFNFGTLAVKFGNTVATIQSVAENIVTVTVPANAAGSICNVSVSNEYGTRPIGGVLTNAFTYLS